MRVLVVGAGGFVGSYLVPALQAAGHGVLSGRPDWARAGRPEAWRSLLEGIDAAIYLAGTVRDHADGHAGWLELLHHRAPLALLQAGVPRLVQVSALCGGRSAYALSKHRGDAALLAQAAASGRALHVVRPSLLLGEGGLTSRQLALLARLPGLALPRAMQRCRLQPLRVEDLAPALVALLAAPASGRPLAAVGAEIDTLPGWLARRRAQRGGGAARMLDLPEWLVRTSARWGDHLRFTSWNRQTLDLLQHDSIEPDPALSAWLPELLGRPLHGALQGPW
jgi:uncharacterized protein YbjT (DUF2867 family)